MKKAILGLILTVLMIMPFSVFAQEKVNVYFFHGDGCPHCADAETFFNSLDESEKEKFELVKYEVWYSEENAELMQKISDMRNDNANGVPYIIIGDNKWIGYSSYYDNAIIKQIDAEYEKNPSLRYDVMDEYELLKDTISTNDNTDVYDYDDTDYDNDKDYEGDIEEFLDSHIPQFLIGSGLILVAIAGLILLVPIVVVIIIIVLVTRKKK